ncbi:hypothetical protein ABVK25_007701 [Lepraria finkii]|uniref:Uncharacterized protein n=1 Tax=Lepraria finkii TaxID=1340010 RepID=A0ABR4B521_9LECA
MLNELQKEKEILALELQNSKTMAEGLWTPATGGKSESQGPASESTHSSGSGHGPRYGVKNRSDHRAKCQVEARIRAGAGRQGLAEPDSHGWYRSREDPTRPAMDD